MSSTSPAENLAQADVPSAEQVRRRRLVAAGAQDLRNAVVRREAVTPTGQSSDATTRIIDTHAKDIDRDTRKVINSVREGVGKGYYAHRARCGSAERFQAGSLRARDSNRPFRVSCRYTNEHPEPRRCVNTTGAERHMEEAMHAALEPTTVPWPH